MTKYKVTYRIGELARQHGLKERQLVEMTGLAALTVRNLLKGYTTAARPETLEAFLDAFGLDDTGKLYNTTPRE